MSAFELHLRNMLNRVKIKLLNTGSFSTRPETSEVYTFIGEGGTFDHLPMEHSKKGTEVVSVYPFLFFVCKHLEGKIDTL